MLNRAIFLFFLISIAGYKSMAIEGEPGAGNNVCLAFGCGFVWLVIPAGATASAIAALYDFREVYQHAVSQNDLLYPCVNGMFISAAVLNVSAPIISLASFLLYPPSDLSCQNTNLRRCFMGSLGVAFLAMALTIASTAVVSANQLSIQQDNNSFANNTTRPTKNTCAGCDYGIMASIISGFGFGVQVITYLATL